MKWIVVSDNHGFREPLEQLKLMYPDAAGFIHCGDSEMPFRDLSGFFAVTGNNDYDEDYPEYLVVDMGMHRALVVHGHKAGVSQRNLFLAKQATQLHCDVVFFGHTHVFSDVVADGVRIMNPGSIWRSRDGRGKSYGIFEMDEQGKMSFVFMPYEPIKQKSRWW